MLQININKNTNELHLYSAFHKPKAALQGEKKSKQFRKRKGRSLSQIYKWRMMNSHREIEEENSKIWGQ